jgi:hypothetical protein
MGFMAASDCFGRVWVTVLGGAILLVQGYHPYADDGGIYVAGVERLAHSGLFERDAGFVLAQARFSVFAQLFAVGAGWISLDWLLFAGYVLSLFGFVMGCAMVAKRLFAWRNEVFGAVLAGAALAGLPVAGTALSILDPYLTARSFSTPLGLFAVSACLDRHWGRCVLFTLCALLFHPLMGGYLAGFLVLLGALQGGGWRPAGGLCVGGVAAAGVATWATRGWGVSEAYRAAVLSRTYFFLGAWAWFEVLGILLPLLLLGYAAWRCGLRSRVGSVAAACAMAGATSVACSALFVHRSGPYWLARLQPLREWHVVYLMGVLMLGGWAGRVLFRRVWVGAAAFGALFLGMFAVSRQVYGPSNQVEWPGRAPANGWVRAFLWIRGNTPEDAVIAADPMLVFAPGEDAQNLRAISRRSVLGDYKDGGVAAIYPPAAAQWKREWDAQQGIVTESDAERVRRLGPLGAGWVVLPAGVRTGMVCPYRNGAAEVCRLR